jgi:hypothetical protein
MPKTNPDAPQDPLAVPARKDTQKIVKNQPNNQKALNSGLKNQKRRVLKQGIGSFISWKELS